jgi:hypothetical protein
MRAPRTVWASSDEGPFPVAALALGIEPDLILGALEWKGSLHVLFAWTYDEATSKILATTLMPDSEGILRVMVEPTEVPDVAQALKELKELVE